MHELALSRAIVETAERHAAGRRVVEVRARVGALRQVVPSSLEFYFSVAAAGTLCDGARLEQAAVPARLRCRDCSAEWSPREPGFRCPRCSGGRVEVLEGSELEVESIEVEEPGPPGGAGRDNGGRECTARG
ncbi:MAG: hydrogenase maturation nickel metallochaperone HypA [Solirubrobacterales bacterium]